MKISFDSVSPSLGDQQSTYWNVSIHVDISEKLLVENEIHIFAIVMCCVKNAMFSDMVFLHFLCLEEAAKK